MGLSTLRRGIRRACLAGAAACLVLALVAPSVAARTDDGADDGAARTQVFSGSASALAASVQLDRAGLLPVPDLFRFIVADGLGTYQTSEQRGRASLLYPGSGGILGPGLTCSQFPPEATPVFGPILDACARYAYPLSVTADSLDPDGSTEGSLGLGEPAGPLSATAVGARAHAGPDAVTTVAEVGDIHVLGAPALGTLPDVPGLDGLEPSLLTIGSAVSTTDQHVDGTGALVVDAQSALADVRLLGGLVRIASLVSHARITDGDDDPAAEATLDVSGVTVAGIPARVTDRGLEIATSSQPLGPLLDALADQLGAVLDSVAFRMESLTVEQGVDDDGIAFARNGGLLVELRVPVAGLAAVPGPLGEIDLNGEYVGTVVLGEVGVRAVANTYDPSLRPVTGAGGGSGVSAEDASRGDVAGDAATGVSNVGRGGSAVPGERPAVDVVMQPVLYLFADRLRLLYLAFTLAALGVCLAPGLTLSARLPGGRR